MNEGYKEGFNPEGTDSADFTADKYVAREFLDDDPRVALTKAAVVGGREPERVFMPGVQSGHNMQKGVKYHV
jgi:hypothetical protein